MRLKDAINNLKSNKELKWFITVSISFIMSIAFALYNGFLGIYKHSIWNGSICVYYILLLSIKAIIIDNERKIRLQDDEVKNQKRKKIYLITSIMLFLISIALFTPISLMVLSEKEVTFGMIPAITVATYTTYKITMAIINYSKNRKNQNFAYRQIRTINLIDAILSILTLQYTLISVGGATGDHTMFLIVVITSFIGISIILLFSIISLSRCIKEREKIYKKELK